MAPMAVKSQPKEASKRSSSVVCFNCSTCDKSLKQDEVRTNKTDLYCSTCYDKQFVTRKKKGRTFWQFICSSKKKKKIKNNKKKEKKKQKKKEKKANAKHKHTGGAVTANVTEDSTNYDVCVVGGGFAGAYVAYQLHKNHPNLKVVILEADAEVGGRLSSDDNDPENTTNKDELGGMRIFPSHHKKVADIVTEVGCTLVPVPLGDGDNIFYNEGKHQKKAEVVLDPACGRSPGKMVDECIANYRAKNPDDHSDAYESAELRSLSPREFLIKYGASELEVDAWVTFSGYDIFSDDEVSAAIFVKDGELYSAKLSDDQKYVQQGYQEVVCRMVERASGKVMLNTRALSVRDGKDGKGHIVTYAQNEAKPQELTCKYVVLALPKDSLEKLCEKGNVEGISKPRMDALGKVKIIPLFKCFMEWEPEKGKLQWWMKKGHMHGKSTTDLDLRQVHYYDEDDLLVYNSGKYATLWNERFLKDPAAARELMFDMIKTLHNDPDTPEPDWGQCIHKYWANGSHKWVKNADVTRLVSLVAADVTAAGGKGVAVSDVAVGSKAVANATSVFVCGDAFSSYQGWTLGCVETADICLTALKAKLA